MQMVADIRTEFKNIVRNVDWMDEQTKISALEKADAMITHIAYPDELLDDKKLVEFYADVSKLREIIKYNYLLKLYARIAMLISHLITSSKWILKST